MRSTIKHRREGAFVMSADGEPDVPGNISDTIIDNANSVAPLAERKTERNAQSQDRAMLQNDLLESKSTGPSPDMAVYPGAKNGRNTLMSIPKGRYDEGQHYF